MRWPSATTSASTCSCAAPRSLQERDAELAEVERLLRLEESASAGSCPHCAAPHSRGALFCWQCGATLMERRPSTALGGDGNSTAIMDALLAPTAAATATPTSQAVPVNSVPASPVPAQAAPSQAITSRDASADDGRSQAAHPESVRSQALASEAVTSSEE